MDLQLVFWSWWLLGAVFLLAELLSGTYVFLWLSLASGLTGLVIWLLPAVGWEIQGLIFAVFGSTSLFLWRRQIKQTLQDTPANTLNQRGAQYVGRIFNLVEPIVNGQGRIKVDDTLWKVRGPDCAITHKVKVVAVSGAVLEVQIEAESH